MWWSIWCKSALQLSLKWFSNSSFKELIFFKFDTLLEKNFMLKIFFEAYINLEIIFCFGFLFIAIWFTSDNFTLQKSKQNLIALYGKPAECLILVNLSSSAAATVHYL